MNKKNDIELDKIRQKTIFGFIWEISSTAAQYIINFINGLILVRILQPYDYGLVALTYIFIRLATILSEGGFSRYIIQKKDADDLDYSTAFIANVVFAFFLYSILFVMSPLIADFYKEPELVLLLRVISLAIIFNSFNIVHLTILLISYNFKLTSIISITEYIIAAIVSILFAFYGFSYWALVALLLTPSIIALIILWLFSGIRFKIRFDKGRFIRMIQFSKAIILLDILDSFSNDIYTSIIGKIDSTRMVGIFNRAQQTHSYVNAMTKYSLVKLMKPVFRDIQENMELVRDTILRLFEMTFYINISIIIICSVFANEIFLVLYTSKWIESVWIFQLLSIAATIAPMNYILSNILITIGQSKLYTRIEWLVKLSQLLIIIIFIFSFKLLLIGLIVFELLQLVIRLYFYYKYLKFDLLILLNSLIPYIILSIILLLFNIGFKFINLHINIYLYLAAIFVLNILIINYYGKLRNLRTYKDIWDMVNELKYAIRQKLSK